jgi:hypothetical protein
MSWCRWKSSCTGLENFTKETDVRENPSISASGFCGIDSVLSRSSSDDTLVRVPQSQNPVLFRN